MQVCGLWATHEAGIDGGVGVLPITGFLAEGAGFEPAGGC
jgi:hypothetical protein